MSKLALAEPGETRMDRAREIMRRAANYVAFEADMDAITLYDVRGDNEETFWRHFWLYAVRTGFDVSEADMARVLSEALVALGKRKPKTQGGKDVHHDSIANACHHIEDLIAHSPDAAAFIEDVYNDMVAAFRRNRTLREKFAAARAALKAERKRDRADKKTGAS